MLQEDNRFENFWNRDIADVLHKDVALREKLAKYFVKNTGSGGNELFILIEHILRLTFIQLSGKGRHSLHCHNI